MRRKNQKNLLIWTDQNLVTSYRNIPIIHRKHTVRLQIQRFCPYRIILAEKRYPLINHYLGTEIISSSGNQESVFLAESNLTEIESIISNDRSEKTFSPKSNLLINSWCYVSQIFIKIGKIAEANKCIDEIRAIGKG